LANLTQAELQKMGVSFIQTKTAFNKVFSGGVTGGDVVTTAAELVTALNNSAYWGMMMCPELIAELAKENVLGKYYDLSDPPVITAKLAPGNHGLFAVSTFEEVAYYGNPNDGTALQFLGGLNSANIRFVVDGPNSELSIDRTTVPAVIGNSQAVLTAQDSGASLTITSLLKGGDYDDVQFVFKRVGEDASGVAGVDRRDGWVEYDPGTSFAYAQATFKNATTNQVVANSAFYVTATERGDLYNNVDIVMRLDDFYTNPDPVTATFDSKTGQLRISIDSTKINSVTTNDVVNAINKANVGFQADLSYSEDPKNDGSGKLSDIGLSASRYTSIANTGETGGHLGGTVTVWLADENPGPGAPDSGSTTGGVYRQPTQEDAVRLINSDPVVSKLFVAKAYNSVQNSDSKLIDFVKDGPIVSSGGLIEPAVITVHLATDKAGNVTTTAADLVKWWGTLDPALVDNISASVVRPAGAVWDECDDPYGNGILGPTVKRGDCDQWIIEDIMFVGWNDTAEQQHYVAKYSTGIMTSQRGIDSSYQLIAKILGPEWDGFTIEYVHDESVSGYFSDNLVDGSAVNPCDNDPYSGLPRDDCGYLITPNSTTEKGLRLIYDENAKKIVVHVNFGRTTANDIQQLINSDPRTRNLFRIMQLGNGTGLITADDNTLLTTGGAAPPGNLNGAKLLFGSDATDYYLIFRSKEYGSDQFVDVQATAVDGGNTTFTVSDANGKTAERGFGKDVDALINGVRAVGSGLNMSLNTSSLALNFTFSEHAGTTPGWGTSFTIDGGGATFQVGPDVVSRQQITMGIRSINTVMLGGVTGVLNQLRSGMDADLSTDTNKAFRIIEESLLAITSIRGRLGTMQKATLETNINVLTDTLSALTEAESQIRDTDFAEETSNLTRAQILVQANMNTLGIANQIPNYMLSLLGR
jgi:flagellin-like hook-associated protein FlgL